MKSRMKYERVICPALLHLCEILNAQQTRTVKYVFL